MGMSKQDMAHRKANLKAKLIELEKQALSDHSRETASFTRK